MSSSYTINYRIQFTEILSRRKKNESVDQIAQSLTMSHKFDAINSKGKPFQVWVVTSPEETENFKNRYCLTSVDNVEGLRFKVNLKVSDMKENIILTQYEHMQLLGGIQEIEGTVLSCITDPLHYHGSKITITSDNKDINISQYKGIKQLDYNLYSFKVRGRRNNLLKTGDTIKIYINRDAIYALGYDICG